MSQTKVCIKKAIGEITSIHYAVTTTTRTTMTERDKWKMTKEEAEQHVTTAATSFKETVDAGMYAIDSPEKFGKFAAAMVLVGLAVRTYIAVTGTSPKDPLETEIEKLIKEVVTIQENMKQRFDDLKLVIAQYSFYNDVPIVVEVLSEFLDYALKSRAQVSIDEFHAKYDEYRPLEYARRLNYQLDRPTTNPFLMLKEVHADQAKKTFNDWKKCFNSLMSELVRIEATACELINDGDKHRLTMIEKEQKRLNATMKTWSV